jgi:hypothetical protein
MVKERPILFSAPMVRAILEGRKTQTRRAIKPQPTIDEMGNFCWNGWNYGQDANGPCIQSIASPIPTSRTKRVLCPYGKPGDRLWVRETWCVAHDDNGPVWNEDGETYKYWYQATDPDVVAIDDDGFRRFRRDGMEATPWKSPIYMPRRASRILLEITDITVDRLCDISEQDAEEEGVEYLGRDLSAKDHWKNYFLRVIVKPCRS